MRALFRDFNDGTLAVSEVTNTNYYLDDEILEFIGTDRDFAIHANKATAEKLVRSLYQEDKVDVSMYEPADPDFFCDDEDDFDEEEYEYDDEDDDEEGSLSFVFADDDDQTFRIPRTIRFPKKP